MGAADPGSVHGTVVLKAYRCKGERDMLTSTEIAKKS